MFQRITQSIRLGLAMLLLAAACLHAPAQRYTFRNYAQGLGNLNISAIMQDRTGYLWVGTQNGLYRYDGVQFQSFGPAQGVPERMIETLFVDLDGTLWVATSSGIYFELPSGQFAEVHPPAGAPPLEPSSHPFAVLRSGEIVLATRSGAYTLRRTAVDTWIAAPLHLVGNKIASVIYSADGALWYGCDRDLCRMKDGQSERMGQILGLPDESWTTLLVARDGSLWIRGSVRVGVVNTRTLRYTPRDADLDGLPEVYPSFAEDSEGRVLTCDGTSLALWENGAWHWITERNGIGDYALQTLYVDREGSVWFGAVGHGLNRWVGQDQWEGYTRADGLRNDLVWSVLQDAKQRIWIGTQSGLNWMEPGDHAIHSISGDKRQASPINSLTLAADGAIWAASLSGEIMRIDPGSLTSRAWSLPGTSRILADHQGHILISTSHGLFTMNQKPAPGEKPQRAQIPFLLDADRRFTDLCIDKEDRIWAASDTGLLVRDASGWHPIDMGSPRMTPDVIAVDNTGAVWIAGPAQVLMRLRIGGYRVEEARSVGRPPLLSQQIVALMVDSRGWLWVGQDLGLSMFDGTAWKSYTQDDGLIWNDTDSFALTEGADGSIWVGTSGGLGHLLAPAAVPQHQPRAPAFTRVTLNGNLIANGGSAAWDSGTFEISVALLSFKSTQDARLRYRLRGPHQNAIWEESHEMRVRYRDLAPGNYLFEVTQIDAAGRSVSPVALFAFRIMPRWWQLTWLRAVFALFLVLVVIAIWRWRMGALLNKNRQLEVAVHARTQALEREKGELLNARNQLRYFAEHDDLTSLWNHRIIVERLRIEVDRSRRERLPLSIILIDLDFFKRINDTFGHPAGDAVLREASAIFQSMVRTYDWVGRYGGEEFLLILPGASCTHAHQRAEELREAISRARVHEGTQLITMTASLGVACGYPTSHDELIQLADDALYQAKNKGRNCVVAVEVAARRGVEDIARSH